MPRAAPRRRPGTPNSGAILPRIDRRRRPESAEPRALDEFRRNVKLHREHRKRLAEAIARMESQSEGGVLPTEALPIVTDMVVKMGGNACRMLDAETRARESMRRLRDEGLRLMEDSELMDLLRRAAELSGYVDAAQLRIDARARTRSFLSETLGLPPESLDAEASALVDRLFPAPVEHPVDLRRVLVGRMDRDIRKLDADVAELRDDPIGLPDSVRAAIDVPGVPLADDDRDGADPDDL